MRKRFVIAGIYRSASTWIYNVVRLLCEKHGSTYACFEDQYNPEDIRAFHVVKHHKFKWHHARLINSRTTVITSVRSVQGITDSMNRLKELGHSGNYTDTDNIPKYFEWLAYWNLFVYPFQNSEGLPIGCVQFDRIIRCPEKVINEIMLITDIHWDAREILEQVNKLNVPAKGIDPVTLLHANHITKQRGKENKKAEIQ